VTTASPAAPSAPLPDRRHGCGAGAGGSENWGVAEGHMNRLLKVLVGTSLALSSCAKAPPGVSDKPPDRPLPTPAEQLVERIDRSPERAVTWDSLSPDATRLGIATPPSPAAWQQMLDAAVHASGNTQHFLVRSGVRLGPAYAEAACRTFDGRVRDNWVKMACVDWRISSAPQDRATAASVLRLTRKVLSAPLEPAPPNGGYTPESYWTSLTLPRIWYVPKDAEVNRESLLAWVDAVLSRQAEWHYSEKHRHWIDAGVR
jgi:hypothetical protein